MFLDSVGQVTRYFCKGSPCWSPKRRTKTNTSHHLVGPLELYTKTKQARLRTRKTSHLVGFLEIDRNRQSNTLFLRDPQRVFSGVSFEHQSQAVDSLRWGTRAASFGVHKKRPWSWELFGGRGIPSPLNTSPELAPLLFLFFYFLHFLGPLWSTNQATSLDCLLGILSLGACFLVWTILVENNKLGLSLGHLLRKGGLGWRSILFLWLW